MGTVIKRGGRKQAFSPGKIRKAIEQRQEQILAFFKKAKGY